MVKQGGQDPEPAGRCVLPAWSVTVTVNSTSRAMMSSNRGASGRRWSRGGPGQHRGRTRAAGPAATRRAGSRSRLRAGTWRRSSPARPGARRSRRRQASGPWRRSCGREVQGARLQRPASRSTRACSLTEESSAAASTRRVPQADQRDQPGLGISGPRRGGVLRLISLAAARSNTVPSNAVNGPGPTSWYAGSDRRPAGRADGVSPRTPPATARASAGPWPSTMPARTGPGHRSHRVGPELREHPGQDRVVALPPHRHNPSTVTTVTARSTPAAAGRRDPHPSTRTRSRQRSASSPPHPGDAPRHRSRPAPRTRTSQHRQP